MDEDTAVDNACVRAQNIAHHAREVGRRSHIVRSVHMGRGVSQPRSVGWRVRRPDCRSSI